MCASRDRMLVGVAVALISGVSSVCGAQRTDDPDLAHYVWDLSALYPDQAAWERERDVLVERVKMIPRVRGTGIRSASAFADELDAVADLRTRAAKMAIYGFLVTSVDSSSAARVKYDVGTALRTSTESAVGFLPHDVLRVDRSRLMRWLHEEPRLTRHRIRILRILREAPYTVSGEVEGALTSMSRWPQTSYDLWSVLNDADLGWPRRRNAAGEEVVLNLNGVNTQFDGAAQVDAYEGYLQKMHALQDIYGLLLTRRIEADLTIARQRGFANGMDALWFRHDGMPAGSPTVMIDVAHEHAAVARRYLALRGRALGLDHASYRDLVLDPPLMDQRFRVADALTMSIEASAPFGPSYQQRLRGILDKKWMYLAVPAERAGSYGIYPPVGGIPPYFVMRYGGDYASARRLMAGLTLMMSNVDIPQDGLPDNWDDAGIYGNGVLYIGRDVFDDYMDRHTSDRQERIATLVNALDFDFQYFRYVMWAELDRAIEERLIDGGRPTGAEVSGAYVAILRRYFGDGAVPDVYASEWMTNHLPFGNYEYQLWPPAMAMAAAVVRDTAAADGKMRRVVDELLGRSDYDRTYPMLKEVGIDLTRREPYQAVMDRMAEQMDTLEGLLTP